MNEQRNSAHRWNRMTVAELLGHVTRARLILPTSMGTRVSARRTSADWRRVLAPSTLDSQLVVECDEYHGITLLKSADGDDDIGRIERADEGTLYRR
jgi:hypothetical protein